MTRHQIGSVSALCAVAALMAGCAAPAPAAPTVMALPGNGKTAQQFQYDDYVCRQQALAAIGGVSPSQAANQSAAGSAVLGTLAGAAIGAGLGSLGGNVGAGAAIGAAGGLALGAGAGANAAQASGMSQQQHYDFVYAPCMVSRGDTVQQPGYPGYPPPPPGYYPPPPPPPY
jgi:hypothetical protein